MPCARKATPVEAKHSPHPRRASDHKGKRYKQSARAPQQPSKAPSAEADSANNKLEPKAFLAHPATTRAERVQNAGFCVCDLSRRSFKFGCAWGCSRPKAKERREASSRGYRRLPPTPSNSAWVCLQLGEKWIVSLWLPGSQPQKRVPLKETDSHA